MTLPLHAVTFRLARAADAEAIARLHAASWRAHYRGSLGDAYLDGPIERERRDTWKAHLDAPAPGQMVVVAEDGGALVGFLRAARGEDPVSGTLIDNLHVTFARKGGGIGRALMREAARRLADAAPDRPVHLFVKAANVSAQAFYARLGGEPAGREVHAGPDGSLSEAIRIRWASPAALAAGCGPRDP